MPSSEFESYKQRMHLAQKGGGILFCGAGFSADCLSFEAEQTLGTGAQLLSLFNSRLERESSFKDLRNAAEELQEKIGEHRMMALLKAQFKVSEVTQDMVDIMRFPWGKIYTTNYDNAIEVAATQAGRRYESLNNSDDPSDDPPADTAPMAVMHLHGFIDKWDIHNFSQSCVLTADSYISLTRVEAWLKRFRDDIDRADFVAFVGFSAEDFHIKKVIYNLTGLREKAVFINRPQAEVDPDIEASQRRLGVPLYLGRSGFARDITAVLASEAPKAPRLASFQRFQPPRPAISVPQVDDIEKLFIFGKTIPEQLARDITDGVSDYHMAREIVADVLKAIEGGARVILLTGYTCDGKSLVLNDLLSRLSTVRPAYNLVQYYESLLNEVASILNYTPDAALGIENCFDLSPERLKNIAAQFDGQDRVLLLTSRSISTEASGAGFEALKSFDSFQHIPIPAMSEAEADALIELVDRFAGWRHFHSGTLTARRKFILRTCEASLPHFLLRLLDSKYVRDRYRQEFSRISLNTKERDVVIVALYMAHIGEGVPVAFISNLLEVDAGAVIDRLNKDSGDSGNNGFHLVRRNGAMLETVPSIGAKNILKNLFGDKAVVDTVVAIIKRLAQIFPRTAFEQAMLGKMMRYSILNGVVTNRDEINRFFNHNAQWPPIRRMPLFWLQWHMAKTDEGEYLTAEKYLEQGYKEADGFDRRTSNTWNRKQLDDRRAKFLMIRAANTTRTGAELFRDFKEALQLAGKLFQSKDLTHHTYETLGQIAKALEARHHDLSDRQKDLVSDGLAGLLKKAEAKVSFVAEGYQRDKADKALSDTKTCITKLQASG